MMLDLDNTLIDRDAAFGRAAAMFLAAHHLPSTDLAWITAIDAYGRTPRDVVATAIQEKYRNFVSDIVVRAFLDSGGADFVALDKRIELALLAARKSGWICVIVTNGHTSQKSKIRNAGLDKLVDGWVISEEVGHKKPAPEIFHAAANMVHIPVRDAWMIGDSPQADIAGAVALGIKSMWVSNSQRWTQLDYEPTDVAVDAAAAIQAVLARIQA